MSSLVKIPLVVAATFGAWYALTPPQPPPSTQERVKIRDIMCSFESFVRTYALVWKCFVIATLLAELVACVLLETHNHRLPLPFLPTSKHRPLPPYSSALPATFVVGCLTMAASGALRWACYRKLDSLFTFELSLRKDHRLVTDGPYAFVRHPSYSGTLLFSVGTPLVQFGPGSWWARAGWLGTFGGQAYALCWCAFEAYTLRNFILRAQAEDVFLRKRFGAEWDAWAARVPNRVIPGVF